MSFGVTWAGEWAGTVAVGAAVVLDGRPIRALESGDCFGEIALIRDVGARHPCAQRQH